MPRSHPRPEGCGRYTVQAAMTRGPWARTRDRVLADSRQCPWASARQERRRRWCLRVLIRVGYEPMLRRRCKLFVSVERQP